MPLDPGNNIIQSKIFSGCSLPASFRLLSIFISTILGGYLSGKKVAKKST
jgi:hypothetical protein